MQASFANLPQYNEDCQGRKYTSDLTVSWVAVQNCTVVNGVAAV